MTSFQIIGEITDIELIAVGSSIRDVTRLRKRYIDESGEDYLFPADYFILIELPRKIDLALRASFSRSPQSAAA
jgi:hypothetical protein